MKTVNILVFKGIVSYQVHMLFGKYETGGYQILTQ